MIVISSIINCFFGFLGKFKNQISGLFLFCIGRRLGKEEEKIKSRSATDDTISIKAKPLGKQNRRGG